MALKASAIFSDNGSNITKEGKYRLWLDIDLSNETNKRTACALMMNPSTATVENGCLIPDRTVTKLCYYAKREFCNRLIIVNVFAIRLTYSKKLHLQIDPIGNPLNDIFIKEALNLSDIILVGWGKLHPSLFDRELEVRRLIKTINKLIYALKINKDGSPTHPLYLKNNSPLIDFCL